MPFRYKITKRTFKAKQFPKGSIKRKLLNRDNVTSEYLPSYKWSVKGYEGKVERTSTSFPTKKQAESFVRDVTDPSLIKKRMGSWRR